MQGRPGARAACVVHHDIDATEGLQCGFDQCFQLLLFHDVAGHGDGGAARGADGLGRGLYLLDGACRNDHACACFREGFGAGGADAAPCTGDDRDLAVQPEEIEDSHDCMLRIFTWESRLTTPRAPGQCLMCFFADV